VGVKSLLLRWLDTQEYFPVGPAELMLVIVSAVQGVLTSYVLLFDSSTAAEASLRSNLRRLCAHLSNVVGHMLTCIGLQGAGRRVGGRFSLLRTGQRALLLSLVLAVALYIREGGEGAHKKRLLRKRRGHASTPLGYSAGPSNANTVEPEEYRRPAIFSSRRCTSARASPFFPLPPPLESPSRLEGFPLIIVAALESKAARWEGIFSDHDLVFVVPGPIPQPTPESTLTPTVPVVPRTVSTNLWVSVPNARDVAFVRNTVLGRARYVTTSLPEVRAALIIFVFLLSALSICRILLWRREDEAVAATAAAAAAAAAGSSDVEAERPFEGSEGRKRGTDHPRADAGAAALNVVKRKPTSWAVSPSRMSSDHAMMPKKMHVALLPPPPQPPPRPPSPQPPAATTCSHLGGDGASGWGGGGCVRSRCAFVFVRLALAVAWWMAAAPYFDRFVSHWSAPRATQRLPMSIIWRKRGLFFFFLHDLLWETDVARLFFCGSVMYLSRAVEDWGQAGRHRPAPPQPLGRCGRGRVTGRGFWDWLAAARRRRRRIQERARPSPYGDAWASATQAAGVMCVCRGRAGWAAWRSRAVTEPPVALYGPATLGQRGSIGARGAQPFQPGAEYRGCR